MLPVAAQLEAADLLRHKHPVLVPSSAPVRRPAGFVAELAHDPAELGLSPVPVQSQHAAEHETCYGVRELVITTDRRRSIGSAAYNWQAGGRGKRVGAHELFAAKRGHLDPCQNPGAVAGSDLHAVLGHE
jgi:hypothetical protein